MLERETPGEAVFHSDQRPTIQPQKHRGKTNTAKQANKWLKRCHL